MPGFYPEGEYDMAGFAVGIVDRDKIIDGSKIKDGDVILVAPGIYSVKLKFKGGNKRIYLGSWFLTTGDKKYIHHTVLKAKWARSTGLRFRREFVIEVPSDCSPFSKIVGFTIKNGNDGIKCNGKVEILNNIFINCKDGIDY